MTPNCNDVDEAPDQNDGEIDEDPTWNSPRPPPKVGDTVAGRPKASRLLTLRTISFLAIVGYLWHDCYWLIICGTIVIGSFWDGSSPAASQPASQPASQHPVSQTASQPTSQLASQPTSHRPASQPVSQPASRPTSRGPRNPQKPRPAVQENPEPHSPRSTETWRPGKPSRQASQPSSQPASQPASQSPWVLRSVVTRR